MAQTAILEQQTEQIPTPTLPEGEEALYEVIDGVRVESEPMSAIATVLASELLAFLREFTRHRKTGLPVTEMLFVLDAERNLKRRPDVAFVSYARWPEATVPRTEAWNVIPDLAVEILSPTNIAVKIDAKLGDYFAAGVKLVWVIYPDSGRVYVYTSPTEVTGRDRSDELDGGDVLPGFRLPIESLFEAVTKPDSQ